METSFLFSWAGQYPFYEAEAAYRAVSHIHAVNHGPLPAGHVHYMQQEADQPNRDRRPESPKEPMMIYVVEMKSG